MQGRVATAISIVVVGSMLAACSRVPSSTKAADSNSVTTPGANGRVMVSCGDDRRALVRQVSIGGQPMAQVECVGADLSAVYSDATVGAIPQIVAPAGEVRAVPAVVYTAPRPVRSEIVRQRPVVYRPARAEVRRARSPKKSAVIIGGTTAGGAGIGALIDGKKGAAIGAGVGLVAGTVYDLVTRDRR